MNERQEERLSPLPEIGEGFGEWSEAPSYEEGVGVDGTMQGATLQKEGMLTTLQKMLEGQQPCKKECMQGSALHKALLKSRRDGVDA